MKKSKAINTYIDRYKYLALSLIFFISGIMIETNIFYRQFNENNLRKFERIVKKKEKIAHLVYDDLAEIITTYHGERLKYKLARYYNKNENYLKKRGVSYIIFNDDEAQFWTENSFYLEKQFADNNFTSPSFIIDHNYYLSEIFSLNQFKIVLLSLVKRDYVYENKFLQTAFQDDFNVSSSVEILKEKSDDSFPVYNSKHEYLFSLNTKAPKDKNVIQRNTAILLFFLGIIFMLFFLHNYQLKFRKKQFSNIFNIFFFLFVIALRYWMVHNKIPYIAYDTDLFSPQYFAISAFVPSLGDLLINSFFILYFIVQINDRIKKGYLFRGKKIVKQLSLISIPIITGLFFLFSCNILSSLIHNSNINFEANKVLELNLLSFAGFIIILLLFYSYTILMNGFFLGMAKYVSLQYLKKYSLIPFIISLLFFLSNKIDYSNILALFTHTVFSFIFIFIHYKREQKFTFSVKFLMILIFAIFTQQYIFKNSLDKDKEIKRLYALNLANEQDPVAELLLEDIEESMKSDTLLQQMMTTPIGNENAIYDYLKKNYFSGFFKKYRLESTICGSAEHFPLTNTIFNCDNYFRNITNKYGIDLPGSNYTFLNNRNGSISYMGELVFSSDFGLVKLYLELNSKLINEELGYPELLLEDKLIANKRFNKYSYGIYNNRNLMARKGDYSYNLVFPLPFYDTEREFYQYHKDSYEHLVYNLDKATMIIISSKVAVGFDHLIAIAYLSLIFFVILLFTEFMNSLHKGTWRIRITFRHKIQFVIISVLLASISVIGIIIIVMNIQQFRNSQYAQLDDKLQSVLAEIEKNVSQSKSLDEFNSEELTYKLIELSTIYFSDINLYLPDGFLKASSRNEVFNYGLCGPQMNTSAFEVMALSKKPKYVHEENIGFLNYLSAYTILKNENNEILGFVNLPYFSKQDVFTEQITSVIITILNIFVIFMVISTIVAVFIANLITKPLDLLNEKMKNLKMIGQNERIDWSANDEIGNLISNYNKMIDQLDESAKLLAESEREDAWREMARQIAHEIKNPLTPMKLNIQFLKRAWQNKDEDFDERLRNVSNSLIEQIDALSQTATEFSNFAKMGEIQKEKTNVLLTISNTVNFFDETEQNKIKLETKEKEIFVHADKEKLLRVFNNLIKNAIQAIPIDKEGSIIISVSKSETHANISVADNGKGIPENLIDRLFEPNFTTKTSGSGLGLPITKSIIESHNGTISFKTELGKGTTFLVSLPLYKEDRETE